jgi:hypothetical protein
MERSVPELKTRVAAAPGEGAALLLSRPRRFGARPLMGAAAVLLVVAAVLVIRIAPPELGAPVARIAGTVAWREAALAPQDRLKEQLPPPVAEPPQVIVAPAERRDFVPSPARSEQPRSNPAPRAAGDSSGDTVAAPEPTAPSPPVPAKPQRAPSAPAPKPGKQTPSGVAANGSEAKKRAKPIAGTGKEERETASGEGACRPYVSDQTMIGGQAGVVGTVCRSADGSWRLVSQYYNAN